ncbi:MAG: isocitrate lyase/PEP mutase family protein [Rhodospirillaceae bacterium]|jgi:2-methylisocitrate lyase-like PEP mutase family enzyme|nr:isocitrate lyase/PEP mutase family protein [Rhodospirillaceae bacterium]MBT6139989.1 isocitrate lyase/PEP mutase family protein [Rhodospirillaceae bacterium]
MSDKTLKARLAADEIVVAPGIYDAFTGLLVEQAGFDCAYLSGASLSYMRYGRPDIGLIGMREVADAVTAIRERIEIPLMVDGDTGYGNALNVIRTVREFERAGASAIQLEDQSLPKRCGHLAGKSLVSADEMVGKIHAALDTRRSEETLIVARTDAIAVEGFEAALDRGERFVEAGCDMIFVEAPVDEEQMRALNARFKGKAPTMANMVEGGSTPIKPSSELSDLGYSFVIFPGGTGRTVAFALQEYFVGLKEHGTTDQARNRMLDFTQFNHLIGTPEMLDLGRSYDPHTVAKARTGADD